MIDAPGIQHGPFCRGEDQPPVGVRNGFPHPPEAALIILRLSAAASGQLFGSLEIAARLES